MGQVRKDLNMPGNMIGVVCPHEKHEHFIRDR